MGSLSKAGSYLSYPNWAHDAMKVAVVSEIWLVTPVQMCLCPLLGQS